jgi:hypothetical protein
MRQTLYPLVFALFVVGCRSVDVPPATPAAPSVAAPVDVPSATPAAPSPAAASVAAPAPSARPTSDVGIDLPAAGPVASMVREALLGSDLPDDSRGTIEFRIGPGGQTLGFRVVASSGGDAEGWLRAAKFAAARLAGARLAGKGLVLTGEYASGATIAVDIVSKVQPSTAPGTHANRVVRTSFRIVAAR